MLPVKIRSHDGQVSVRGLPAERHRRLHLGLLHAATDGYVEVAAGKRLATGKMALVSRKDPGTFLPGGATGHARWLDGLMDLAARHIAQGKEVCVSPAVRHDRAGVKAAVSHTNWLWLDVDGPDGLPALRTMLLRKAPHLIVESAGSGGRHAYWHLDTPLHATGNADEELAWLTGRDQRANAIELAHERIIYALGYSWEKGRPIPTIADPKCRDRSRLMRLPGTINGKTGNYARLVWVDLTLRPWSLKELVGDLPEPPKHQVATRRAAVPGTHDDPYKRIAPAEYFQRLAGIEVPDHGLVSCPSPTHTDDTPSCHVGTQPDEGWYCLAAETRVITAHGTKEIKALAGKKPTLLTAGGTWIKAPVRSFGKQDLLRLNLQRNGVAKTLYATPEHRWFVGTGKERRQAREVTTAELQAGQVLFAVRPTRSPAAMRLSLSPFGIARGITFGDGHRVRKGSRATLYGDKDGELLRWFPLNRTYRVELTERTDVIGLPGYFKDLPAITEDPSYLYGWLAGYFAADGDISENATISLNCARRSVLEKVRDICTRLGIGTYGISEYQRRGYSSGREETSPIYRLRFIRGTLTQEFFLLSTHRARATATMPAYERLRWIVSGVEETDRHEEVFCATVPKTGSFVLEDNILTGNCHGCDAAGAIYDLASVLLGGPTGQWLRGRQFGAARDFVRQKYGEL